MGDDKLSSKTIELSEADDPIELYFQKGWTDGLPIVPPTESRLNRMLEAAGRNPSELIAAIPPKWGKATVEKIAINAVMAGCHPSYLPTVIAAIEAICEEDFNLHAVQVTTNIVSPLLIINGPIRKKLDINSGMNVFGQGWRANATIGRAVRLIMTNLGGALPGELDRATFGHPGKYTYCIAENEEESPWEPLHVERGLDSDDNAITAYAAGAPTNINDHSSNSAEGILTTICKTLAVPGATYGSEALVALGVEHAKTIAADGFSKSDVKSFLHQNALIESGEGKRPIVRDSNDLIVLVAGGTAGRFSIAVTSSGFPSKSVIKKVG